jgi:hypothetical protein
LEKQNERAVERLNIRQAVFIVLSKWLWINSLSWFLSVMSWYFCADET